MAWDSRHPRSQTPPWRRRDPALLDGIRPLDHRASMELRTGLGDCPLSPVTEEDGGSPFSPPLVVSVTVKFADPIIRSTYRRTYGSSPNFEPSDRICNGLLRRIDHCCEELITRKDSTAFLTCKEGTGTPKPLRFEMTFRMARRDTGEQTERTFESYQIHPLTAAFAREVTLASHRMIGLFLSHHDKEFKWLDGSVGEGHRLGRETMIPSLHTPLSPCCIPRSRFVESSQSFEFIPGYTIEVSFKSRSQKRSEHGAFSKVLKINSRQSSPLNLMLSEDLLWQSFQSVDSALGSKKRQFDEQHESCGGLEGPSACQHFDDEGLHLALRVTNNLGPSYDHLHRDIRSKLVLFHDKDGQDCQTFLKGIERQLMEARDGIDSRISQMHDFELRILELKSSTWSIRNPLRFSLDPCASYSRRSIEAVLERVQTGISDVLRGNNIAIHVSAYKRGHLVLEKALVARQDPRGLQHDARDPEDQKKDFVSRLRARIQEDIDKVCKDTCSLGDIPDNEVLDNKETDNEATLASRSDEEKQGQEGKSSGDTPVEDTAIEGSSRDREAPVQRRFPLVGNSKVVAKGHREDCWSDDSQDPAEPSYSPSTEPGEDMEDQAPLAGAARPYSTITFPGSAPGQRFFPLVPDRFSLPSRVSSGCILASEPYDLPTDTEMHDGKEEDHEGGARDEAPEQNEQVHPTEHCEDAPAAELATDSEPHETCSEGSVPAGVDKCPAPSVEDSGVVIEEPVPVPGGPDHAAGDLLPADRVPVFEAEESGPLEEHVSVEEPVSVEELGTTAETVQSISELPCSSEAVGEPTRTSDEEHDETCSLATKPSTDTFSRSRMDVAQTPQGISRLYRDSAGGRAIEPETPSRAANCADSDDDSTAPSTPALSSGCESSPRNSLIITPNNLATLPGLKRPLLRGLEEDYLGHRSEAETETVDGLREGCASDKGLLPGGVFPSLQERAFEDAGRGTALFPPLDLPAVPQSPVPEALATSDTFELDGKETEFSMEADAGQATESPPGGSPVLISELADFDCGSSFLDIEPDSSMPRPMTKFGPLLVSEAESNRAPGLDAPRSSDYKATGPEVLTQVVRDSEEFPAPEGITERKEDEADTELQLEEPGVATTVTSALEISTGDSEPLSESEPSPGTSKQLQTEHVPQTPTSSTCTLPWTVPIPLPKASATPPPLSRNTTANNPQPNSPDQPAEPSSRDSVDDIPPPDPEMVMIFAGMAFASKILNRAD
ncbi:hypothetical protein QBC33DRAFT_327373 [Phialemonium atrogriseum]|uniref:Uncharacterized protein n=1 Tax=Phialemonium atrogriseum TaxID=1093897 RepID=A0AAJ0C3R3_9PEZI|nr:uncharacterized protein QBC33DRAFT_327373 [Phialemonium atrogriseum]KAK1769599.1 hypothetical protein QBC33DRAFT_327373 [Phialemonium atrogriseum]